MAKKKRELTTRRMPSGAQQYVRPAETGRDSPAADRLRTIREIGTRSGTRRNPELGVPMIDALLDESVLARIGGMNERQTSDEDYNNRIRDIRAGRHMKMSGGGLKKSTRPVPRPARGMEASPRPVPRPSTAKERASADATLRASQREAADRDMGMKYGGKVKKMMGGGTCRGMGKATKGGNYSRG